MIGDHVVYRREIKFNKMSSRFVFPVISLPLHENYAPELLLMLEKHSKPVKMTSAVIILIMACVAVVAADEFVEFAPPKMGLDMVTSEQPPPPPMAVLVDTTTMVSTTGEPPDDDDDTDEDDDDDSDQEDGESTTTASLTTTNAVTPRGPMTFRLSTLEPDTLKKVMSPSLAMMTTTNPPATATDAEGDQFRLSLDMANPRCGDGHYKYHYKKYTYSNMWSGLSDVDACCLRPDIQATQDIKVMNSTCCLTQGSLCEDGAMTCCKNAKCLQTEKGEKRCEFDAGFWQTSQNLHLAFMGWKPAKTPMVCTDSRYMFYREASNPVDGKPPRSGCCAMQDTTETQHVHRACCMNSHEGCCFSNGYCRKWVPSTMVPYEMRENDFQKELDPKILKLIQRAAK